MLAVFCVSFGFNPEVTMSALRVQINELSHRGVDWIPVKQNLPLWSIQIIRTQQFMEHSRLRIE